MNRTPILLPLLLALVCISSAPSQQLRVYYEGGVVSPLAPQGLLWGEDVHVTSSEPLARLSSAGRPNGVGYLAVPDTNIRTNRFLVIYKTTDFGKTWGLYSSVGPTYVPGRAKVVRSGLDSVYIFFQIQGTLFCLNPESFNFHSFDSANVTDWDVAAMKSGSLQLFVEHGASRVIRRYSSTDGGVDWTLRALVGSPATTPRVYASLAADTLIASIMSPIRVEPLYSAIMVGRYREGTPGLLSNLGYQNIVTDSTRKHQFAPVYCNGAVWFFYSVGEQGSIDLRCRLSTDRGATYGAEFPVADSPGFDEYWFDAMDYGSGADIIYYADSLAPVTNNMTDKIMFRFAGTYDPVQFTTPKQISQHPPSWSPRNYIPAISEYGSMTGALWVGADLDAGGQLGVYYDNFRFPTPTVLSPNGGETWLAGSKHMIRWGYEGVLDTASIHYTTNGGSTWVEITPAAFGIGGSYAWTVPAITADEVKVRVTVANTTWGDESDSAFSIATGTLLGTWRRTGVDAGMTYAIVPSPGNQSIVFAGSYGNGVLRSSDRGETWSPDTVGLTNLNVTALARCRDLDYYMYCGTASGVFVRYEPGGPWDQRNTGIVESPANIQALAVHPASPNIAYAAVYSGTTHSVNGLYKTADFGWTWVPTFTLPDSNKNFLCVAIDPVNPDIVYAGTSFRGSAGPQLYRSTDAGATWATTSNGLPAIAGGTDPVRALSIHPSDTRIILAGLLRNTTSGGVYLTTNSGAQWTHLQNGLPADLQSHVRSVLINPGPVTELYAGLDRSGAPEAGVFRSTDLGLNWSSMNGGDLPPQTTVRALAYLDSYGALLAGGANGPTAASLGVFKNAYTFTDVGGSKKELPETYALGQNYPNPFNPTTVVSYQLSVASNVRLVVYDLLGREVTVLVNERKAPGRYEVQFDASRLASGAYFYRLTANGFVQTRKMLLIR